jgi:AcrR family transcriptional regulator
MFSFVRRDEEAKPANEEQYLINACSSCRASQTRSECRAPRLPIPIAVRGGHLYNVHIVPSASKHPYHHGDLREALLKAAEKLIRQQGLNALTLRAVARAAGVSHAAPAHHFKDLSGLLTELAIDGFRRLRDSMQHATRDASYMPWFVARAYVLFAIENSELFLLMFRSRTLDSKNPTLQQERVATFSHLSQASDIKLEDLTLAQLGALTAGWSIAHGFAMLYIDGPIKRILKHAPPNTELFDLLQATYATLAHSKLRPSDAS